MPDKTEPEGPAFPKREDRKIVVSRNGPYLVTGSVPLSVEVITNDRNGYAHHWRKGATYPMKERYGLCRCGKSGTRPFCDGKHEKDFDGTEVADRVPYREKADRIEGPELTLTDCLPLCSSAKFCDRAGGIWDLTRESDIPAAKQTAITEAANCPSGRLVVWDTTTGVAIEPEFVPSIGLIEYPKKGQNGPIWVRGGIPVVSEDGTPYEIRNRLTLCRCGRSENKPFCDSSHLDDEQG